MKIDIFTRIYIFGVQCRFESIYFSRHANPSSARLRPPVSLFCTHTPRGTHHRPVYRNKDTRTRPRRHTYIFRSHLFSEAKDVNSLTYPKFVGFIHPRPAPCGLSLLNLFNRRLPTPWPNLSSHPRTRPVWHPVLGEARGGGTTNCTEICAVEMCTLSFVRCSCRFG